MDNMFAELKAIQASMDRSFFMIDPETEPRFIVNSDKREIEIPDEFKFLAVKTDHVSEKIYFEVDRYFDGEDLSTKACVVQYINTGDGGSVEGIYPVTYIDLNTNPDKIIFRWEVDNNVSKYAGMVSFSVRFYTISDDNRFTYSWNTIPAQLPILDTINNTGNTVSENYPTELVEWNYRMQQLDRTISEKIATATESIDANTKAAQAARKGAEDAEARVNAIVAGNEAYTKQQSHDLFALALRGTAEAAKSITIYPDSGSNVAVTIHGFTKQEGDGNPEPPTVVDGVSTGGNVRKIIRGGMRLREIELSADWAWETNNTGGWTSTHAMFYAPGVVPASTGEEKRYTASTLGKTITGSYFPDGNVETVLVTSNGGVYIRYRKSEIGSTVNELKAFLRKKKDAGNPVLAWYVPSSEVDATGLYAPLLATGDGYMGRHLKLTDYLGEGSTIIPFMNSGCDRKITVDGVEKKFSDGGSTLYNVNLGDGKGFPSTKVLRDYGIGTITNTGYNLQFLKSEMSMYGSTADELNKYCESHPLTLLCKTVDYTKESDIRVSLETQAQYCVEMTGNEGISLYWNNHKDEQLANGRVTFSWPMPKAFKTSEAAGSSCSHVKHNAGITGGMGNAVGYMLAASKNLYVCLDLSTIDAVGETDDAVLRKKILDYLKIQNAAGTPFTVVYKVNLQQEYAHDPVDFIASPDEDGALVIAGESDGTVSAEFNKSITKTFEELVQRVSALELQAL